ncbi:MAG: GTPase ObgE [bacterium]|nr:GTPase ObgE [bacterium]
MKFLDKAKIRVISGHGGNGMVAWRREKYVDKGGPAGGDGGNGGDIYFIGDENMSTLLDFKIKSVYKADSGINGGIKGMHGACAKNLYIRVPLGTIVRDSKSGKIIADITEDSQQILIAKGGRGGRGNARFATAQKRAPQFCEPGEPGIERVLELELKLIADVGLLGMPNVGKSTFISAVSSAKPKIADYPFTTLVPNLGVVQKSDGSSYVIADIPGLIEGASDGVGLGHEFLRHVERCRFLVHVIDLTADNPLENFKIINNELEKHSKELANLYQIVVLNKTDAINDDDLVKFKTVFNKIAKDIYAVSAVTKAGMKDLLYFMEQKVNEIPKPENILVIEEDTDAYNNDDSSFEIIKLSKDVYKLTGGKINRLAKVTDIRNTEQVVRLQNILKSMGVFDELSKSGLKDGDTLLVGHLELGYYDDEIWGEGSKV